MRPFAVLAVLASTAIIDALLLFLDLGCDQADTPGSGLRVAGQRLHAVTRCRCSVHPGNGCGNKPTIHDARRPDKKSMG
jgi:hypothetical protein